MLERALVHQSAARKGLDRKMAEGVQRGKTEETTGRVNPRSLCKNFDRKGRYNARKTLDPSATQAGGTSDRQKTPRIRLKKQYGQPNIQKIARLGGLTAGQMANPGYTFVHGRTQHVS